MRNLISAAAVLAMLGCGNSVFADTISINAVSDAFIIEEQVNNNTGGHTHMAVGVTGAGNARRGLVFFDVATLIPANATVTSVRLEFDVSQSGGNAHLFELYRLTNSWGEGDNLGNQGSPADNNEVTWNDRFFNNLSWTTPGGDFAGSLASSASVDGAGTYTFASSSQFVSDTQDMLDNGVGDFGFLIKASDESSSSTAMRVGSREGGSAARLIVDFAPIPEPNSGILIAVILGSLGFVRKRIGK